MAGRTRKKTLRHASNIQRHRIEIEDDFEIVQARTSSLSGPAGMPVESMRDGMKGHTTWNIGDSWGLEDDPEFMLDEDSLAYDSEMDADVGDVLKKRSEAEAAAGKKKRSQASARPQVFWKENYRQAYLDELIRADGRGEFRATTQCPDCVSRGVASPLEPVIRCRDCFIPDLTCESCCVRRHTRHPLHQVEKWVGTHFVKTSLKDVGLVIHLNHTSLRCPLPSPLDKRFRILHTNGIHEIALSYCGCSREIPRHLQLLRRGLYPSTHDRIRTCVTTELLRLLHILSLTAKTAAYDFYRSLERLTPNNAVRLPKRRYRPLMRVLTQWRHLKMLKRAGRGHDPSGAAGTANGELAMLCPSCPHPGINLDDNWINAPLEKRFLYALLLCLDANFRLKNNLVSNYSNDPGLGLGMAYMVPYEPYKNYVLSQADEEDISTCVGFQALAKATTRNTKGLRYTGVGAAVCGRSEMVLPNAVGNLQKGERYANMDYIFASAAKSTKLLIVCVSYDVVCQWFINVFSRMLQWPSELHLRPGLHLRPYIPKFHYWAHKDEGHEQYSFNYGDGAGLSDGEAIERVWGSHNTLAGSTKVSGPGTRQDILDDNFGFWNYLKYISMGKSLISKYKSAVSERNKQVEAHRGFTASLPSALAVEWEEMCVEWSADTFPKTAPSPFKTNEAEITEADAKAEIEAAELAARPFGSEPLHETSAASFLWMGLELEESQRRLKDAAAELSKVPTNLQTSALRDQRDLLKQKIHGWEQLRSIYIPGLVQLLVDKGTNVAALWDTNPNPEDMELWLPSAIPLARRRSACIEGLPDAELKLRVAQCSSSLQGLRQVLRLKTRMVYFKNKNIRGQRDGTRSRAVIDRVHKRALRFVNKYRAARRARLSLEGSGEWELTFQELKNDDVRSYSTNARRKRPERRGIWEDGHEPAPVPTRDTTGSDESDAGSDIEIAQMGDGGVRQTAAQELRSRKQGTGETRKEISWIWRTTSSNLDTDDTDHILRAEWAKSRARTHRAREEVELLVEEMRRVIAFLKHSASTWGDRIVLRVDEGVDSSLMEGLQAYANKQIVHQQALSAHFQELWRTPLRLINNTTDGADIPGVNDEQGVDSGYDEADDEDDDEENPEEDGDA